jgi:hypothetical protein
MLDVLPLRLMLALEGICFPCCCVVRNRPLFADAHLAGSCA